MLGYLLVEHRKKELVRLNPTKMLVPSTDRILDKVALAMKWVTKYRLMDRRGGYHYFLNHSTGIPVLAPTLIGEVPNCQKAGKYKRLSAEKGNRLSVARDLVSNSAPPDVVQKVSFSSFGTRNETKGRWGGAIFAQQTRPKLTEGAYPELILSFSGFSEYQDEAVMVIAAIELGIMSVDEALLIANISKNYTIFAYLTILNEGF